MKIDGISALAVILIASFAIDRIVTGLLFLLSFLGRWERAFPDPATVNDISMRGRAEKKQKLAYFIFAALLGVVVCWYGKLRIFFALGFADTPQVFDILATALTLTAGSDRIAALLNVPGAGEGGKTSTRPVEITGKLVLENATEKNPAQGAAPDSVATPL
jgi:hypothetical protein